LTLALGIAAANAAIFTLINSVLPKNLAVVYPRHVKAGRRHQSLRHQAHPGDSDDTLLSTDSYERLPRNSPQFEDLAATQSG
jgi:macrolide transport system ATP-binding/permease protein